MERIYFRSNILNLGKTKLFSLDLKFTRFLVKESLSRHLKGKGREKTNSSESVVVKIFYSLLSFIINKIESVLGPFPEVHIPNFRTV